MKAKWMPLSKHWEKNLAVELFDVASLLKHLQKMLGAEEFKKALVLLEVEEDEWPGISEALASGEIQRQNHSFAPVKDKSWDNPLIIRTFEWVNRFRADLWKLVAGILDLARFIGANAEDLQAAGCQSARFDRMTSQDWQAILNSRTTSFGEWGYHDPDFLGKYVHGQSSG